MKYVSAMTLALALFCCIGTTLPTISAAAERVQTAGTSDPHRLEGQWVRPDGGYVLELRDISKDGELKAAYFNPRPINVHQARWSGTKGILNVFVELRDINYPGSKYALQYDPSSDRLKGSYFQAVERQTYTVEFVRGRR